jgi:hypothetical protein
MSELISAFEDIYKNNKWGDPSSIINRKNKKYYSGGGTDPDNDKNNTYINLIQSYVDRDDVNTVIEIGCGDWEVSSRINWTSVKYTGYDVVDELIQYNIDTYSNESVKFICDSNIIVENILKADLLIVKDVFQHLPLSFYENFIKDITKNFKYNIITNDYAYNNLNIDFGGYTGNNFSSSPFFLKWDLLIEWEQKYIEAGNKITLSIR